MKKEYLAHRLRKISSLFQQMFILAVATAVYCSQPACCLSFRVPADQEHTMLKLDVRTKRTVFNLNDIVRLELSLKNDSDRPIYIYKRSIDLGRSASLALWITDATSGKSIPERLIADALPPPPHSKGDFVELLPGHVYESVLAFRLGDFISTPGRYRIGVDYQSPVLRSMNFGLSVWSRNDGIIHSNISEITVKN